MVRIVKLYKMHGGVQEVDNQQPSMEPSKVGKKLTDMTTKRLIVLILVMVLVLPFMYADMIDEDFDPHAFVNANLENLHRYPQTYNESGTITEDTLMSMISFFARKGGNLLFLELCVDEAGRGGEESGCTQGFSASFIKQKLLEKDQVFSYCPRLTCETRRLGQDMMTSESAVEQRYRKWEMYRMWNYNCYARSDPDDDFSSSGAGDFVVESDKAC